MNLKQLLLAVAAAGGFLTAVNRAAAQGWTSNSVPLVQWNSVTSSADGTKLAVAIYGGTIYTSANSGSSWLPSSALSKN